MSFDMVRNRAATGQSTGTADPNGGLPGSESACAALNWHPVTPYIRTGPLIRSRRPSAAPTVNLYERDRDHFRTARRRPRHPPQRRSEGVAQP
ncbi:hypothetical protein GCM10022245_75040 [Streptomyces mayteni]